MNRKFDKSIVKLWNMGIGAYRISMTLLPFATFEVFWFLSEDLLLSLISSLPFTACFWMLKHLGSIDDVVDDYCWVNPAENGTIVKSNFLFITLSIVVVLSSLFTLGLWQLVLLVGFSGIFCQNFALYRLHKKTEQQMT